MTLKIKDTHKDTVIAFNNSGIPLGKRNQEDLTDLAIMAHESGNKLLLDAFEGQLPPLKRLKSLKMKSVEKVEDQTNNAADTEINVQETNT